MYPGVELRLYRYVAALAEVLNFTHAASRLHVSQPTLSTQIRELEKDLGVKLFSRTKGGQHVALTSAGEAFTAQARLTLLHAERAVEGARAAAGQHTGVWSLGYSPLIDLRILSKVRQYLSEAHPTVHLRLVSAHTSEQADGLIRGKLQAGLVILPVQQPGLTCESLYREGLVLALSECHPLANKREVEIADLHELPIIIIRGDIEPRFGEDLNRIFAVARIRPSTFHEATTQAEALQFVSDGCIAALTMPSAQCLVRDRIVFRSFVDDFLTAQIGLAYFGESEPPPILTSLKKFLYGIFQPLRIGTFRDGHTSQLKLF
jgi:LysR family transcriptional regulator, hca operon transcriptional activator